MKPPNKFNTTAVTTYLGSINVKYAPIIDADTVDIAEAVKVYKRCLGIYGNCCFNEINTSDCPRIAAATALYDSKRPIPLILEIKNPNTLIIHGRILVYCKIPINAEINTIGNKTLKKNGGFFGSTNLNPPKTKLTPSAAFCNK